VLVIGAGETGELTARALRASGVETVFVANRRYDRAIGLAQRFGGTAVRFDDLPAELARTDIVVSSTASPHQILDRDDLELTMAERPDRPLVLIDIAVPRDVDPAGREVPGVALYDMDDLQRAAARGRSVREAESTRARSLVEEQVQAFDRWLASLDVVPTIAALRERGEQIVQTVLRENEQRWESLSAADRDRLTVMARAVVSRLLHEPTLRLKQSVAPAQPDAGTPADDSYFHVQALRDLFGLDAAPPELDEEPRAEVTDIESRRHRRS
jgi:glutamyl-tRNA reductase